jgi:hypothetical protein
MGSRELIYVCRFGLAQPFVMAPNAALNNASTMLEIAD